MGIQRDAEELLIYIYNKYLEDGSKAPNNNELIEETTWPSSRVNRALVYLEGKKWIKTISMVNGKRIIKKLNPEGIDVIENEKEFEKHFSHTIDLKLYKYTWGAKEKK